MIKIMIELEENEALAFAQFLKRVSHSDYVTNAVNEEEAYLMKHAGFKIAEGLANEGYNPR